MISKASVILHGHPMVTSFIIGVYLLGQLVYAGDAFVPKPIDERWFIEKISRDLAEGRKETGKYLARLGFAKQVMEIQTLDNNQMHAFSALTMIETLYRRAEAKSKGEGDRFLAVLYHFIIRDSAALAEEFSNDSDFKALSRFKPNDLKRPFKFARLSIIHSFNERPRLAESAENIIHQLAKHYSGRHMSQFRSIALRRFHKEGFNRQVFERILAESKTSKQVLTRLIHEAMPLPPREKGLRLALADAIEMSAALKDSKEIQKLQYAAFEHFVKECKAALGKSAAAPQ